MKNLKLLAFAGIILLACNQKKEDKVKRDVLFSNVDTLTKPTDDFFFYANGGWIKANKIPDDQSGWGIGNLVQEENLTRLRKINEDAAKENAANGTASQKIADFWTTAMDSAKIEANGIKPLAPYLAMIDSITDVNSIVRTSAEFSRIGVPGIFGDYIGQDDKNSDVMAYKLWQSGIGLPDREYYFKSDSSTTTIRNAYPKYISKMLQLMGQDSVSANAGATGILAMETKLANVSRKIEDLRDPYANYNKMAMNDLGKFSSSIDWNAYTKIVGADKMDSVIVGQPEYYKALDNIIKTTPVDVIKNYFRFRLVRNFSNALPEAYAITSFEFNKMLSGAKERRPRWKRVLQSEEDQMGELLGQLYVKEYFNETAKKRYSDLVESIRDAYKLRIQNLTWMTDSTKQKALAKLASIKKKVGYPDKWIDFSAMEIGKESYLQNLINSAKWWHSHEINKLGKPVDREEWVMSPQTYNAYYNASNNEIVLPSGIFAVPGYRDEELDDATVYGNAGASTIGHELTHGFDDEGRQYDEKGNLKNWWTRKDEEEFNRRAQVMIQQFNEYEPLKGMFINGKATLGENIADLGGILIGLDAFKKTEQYKKNEKISGLTPLQRYFMGYSLGWLSQIKDESLQNRLMTDVHSPAKYRVNGPFVNVDEFYTAFNIKQGDKMYRPDSLRVKIW